MVYKLNSTVLAAVVAIGLGATAQSAVYYWDINGSAANTGTSATGSWTGSGVFWNPNVAGNGTAVSGNTAGTSSNDLVFDTYAAGTPGSGYTDGGTVTLSNNRVASSIAFQGNGAMTVTSTGRTLTVGGTGTRQGIYVLSGSANNTVSSAVALANSACTFQNAGSGLLTISGAISSSQNQNLTVNGSGNTTISSVIGIGTGTLTKSGGGILTLSGASSNTFTGLTTVSAGELDLAKTGAANAISGNLTISGGTVMYTGAGTNQIADTRTVTINGAGAIFDLGASHSDTVATVTLDGGGQITGTGTSTLTVNSANTFEMRNGTVSAILGGSGALIKTTANTVTLSGSNTYTGGTLLNAGTLQIAALDSLGALDDLVPSSGYVTFQGGTLQYAPGSKIDVSGRINDIAGGQVAKIDTNGNDVSFYMAIGGDGGLIKLGAGALTLYEENDYLGNTTISDGSLKFGNPTVLQNSTLDYGSGGGSIDFGELMGVTIGGLAGDKDLVLENSESAAPVALSLGNNNADTEYTGNLSGGGWLVKIGTGTLTLSGTNTYDGDTTIEDGILRFKAASLGGAGGITFMGGILRYDGHGTDFSGRINPIDGGFMAKIDTNGNDVSFDTENGLNGEGGLSKLGAGTLTLNAANDYQGGTIVSGGTLLVSNTSGSGTGTGSVTVNNGGTLGGTGAIGGAVIVDAGGHLAPGASVGILHAGTAAAPQSVTMAADSIYEWEFDGTAGDTVAIQGDLTLTSGWKLALVNAGGTPTQKVKYDLFTYTGSLAGSLTPAIDYGDTGWGAALVGQEAGKVYLMFSARSDVLLVAGSPTYDEATSTGLKGGAVEAVPGYGVNNHGMAVGRSIKYVGGTDMGLRAVRWDYTGAAATELGYLGTTIGGYTAALALAVNDAGTAVGRSWKNGNSLDVRAVRWDASGTSATELGILGLSGTGVTTADAFAVNAGGTAVGSAQMYDSGNDMGRRAVRWDASGAATELPNLGLTTGSSKAYAYAINDANTAVGFSQKPGGLSHLGTRAVRWNASGAVTELGNLGLRIDYVTDARAVAVNALGTAVGWATKYVDGNSMGDRAVRWDASGIAATELGSLGTDSSNYAITSAFAVNDSGTAVGYAEQYVSGNLVGTRAVRWDGSGAAATELGNLGLDINNSTEARAYAVNGSGSAVGYSQRYDGGGYVGDRAVIWLPDASAIDLNDLGVVPVPAGGTWTLTTAKALSTDGWVAGDGTFDPDGGGPQAGYVRHWVAQVGLGGTWTNAAGGTWGRGPNWSTGTPAMQVGNATFNLNSVYAVALDRNELTKNIAINAGTVTINSNGHTLTAESGLSIAGGATLKGDGTIVGDIVNAGTLGGTGNIIGAVIVNDGGHLAPGAGIGTLNVGTVADPKSVTMAAGSIYDWELGSTSADLVVVTGNLTLDAGWEVTLVDAGGAPTFADKFDLFSYTMGTVSLGLYNIDVGATGWDVSRASIGMDGGIVYITGIAGLPGDTNDDGVIDAADYITVKQNFGMTGADWLQGNFTGVDGTVDWADLQILMANFGTRSVGGAPAAPEPATLGLLALGAAALLRRRQG